MTTSGSNFKLLLPLAAVSFAIQHADAASIATKKPNVILIFSDQHNADVFGYQGHADVKTPNLDAMAKGGVVFNRAYCQNAISAPSRMSMFTGLYPRTIGAMDNAPLTTNVIKNVVSLQAALQANGYDTYAFGKRHLDAGANLGWTNDKSHLAKESPTENYVRWIEKEGFAEEFGEDWAAEFGEFPQGNSKARTKFPTAQMGTRTSRLDEHSTMEAYSTCNTLEVIRTHKQSGKPFFCFTSFYHPHQPYTPLPNYLVVYDITKWGQGTLQNDGLKMPESLHQPAEELPPMLSALRKSKTGIWCLGLAAEDEQLYRNYMGSYYALVSEIDARVGEIFAELEKTGTTENTLVIYTSDHGDFVGGHGMIEKAALGHNVYEETLRVPLMFFWKGKFPAGCINNDLVGLIDLYPTIMELTGSKQPTTRYKLQGLSLAKTVTAQKHTTRKYLVSENYSQATVITQEYKLGMMLDPTVAARNRDYRAFGNMFFERKSHPYEVKNSIISTALSPVIKKLKGYYVEFEKQVSDEGKREMVGNHPL
ncbi:MAG: sulfatase-like hydrolase/transferase [Bacteroidia bacterium]|nr:sulfatase-like hydrolase/transferase [Bacteroidia bacterium]